MFIKDKNEYVTEILESYINSKASYEFRGQCTLIYEELLEAFLTDHITADDLVWIRYQLKYISDELRNYREFAFYYVNLWDTAGLPTKEGLKAMTGIYECSRPCLMSNYINMHWCFRYPALHEFTYKGNFVYMLFDDEDLIYIGKTNNPNSRLWTHQKDKEFDRVSVTNRGLRNGKLTAQSSLTLEKQLIKSLAPQLNKQHNKKITDK